MAVATAKRRTKPIKQIDLREDYVRQSLAPRIDEEAGIIYGLKICGLTSDNGRDYSPDALREAAPLYEGVPCYSNHRLKGQQREWQDDIGIWRGVKFTEGRGLFGNLHYDKESADAKRLVYRCKNLHENVGFSHDADTDPQYVQIREGRPYITKITVVNSVDLVADPATTSGLTEDRKMQTVKSLLESLMPKLSAVRQLWAKRLLEMDGADVETAGTSYEDALKSAIDAILNDGAIDAGEKAKRISTWLKTHEKMTQAPEPEAPVAEADDAPDDKKDDKKDDDKAMESRLARFERKEEVETLCESLNFTPTKEQKAKLIECADATIRKELATAYKSAKPSGPRSGNAHTMPLREDYDRDENKDKRWESSCLIK